MGIRSQAAEGQDTEAEGSETRAQARRVEAGPKRPAPLWGDDIVQSAEKSAAVWQMLEGKYTVLDNGCWRWEGGLSHGYPLLWVDTFFGRVACPVHRLTYELTNGLIPMEPGGKRRMSVCHRCDNPYCINPEHHFLGTQRQNHADMVAKGRHCIGERNGQTKVTDDAVEQIRRRAKAGERQHLLCKEFGLSPAQISRIIRGRRRGSAAGDTARRHGNFKHGRYAKRGGK